MEISMPDRTPTKRPLEAVEADAEVDPTSPMSPLSTIATTWSRASSSEPNPNGSTAGGAGVGSSSASATAGASSTTGAAPSAKRRKLTQAEREVRAFEKAERDREKARVKEEKDAERAVKAAEKAKKDDEKRLKELAEKAKKDEEKRLKDEEKRVKEEERKRVQNEKKKELEEKQKLKDEEKAKKEEEKAKKEEERLKKEEEARKKEASQSRLNMFFVKPKKAAASPKKVEAAAAEEKPDVSAAPVLSDYEKTFQTFELRANVTLAPFNWFGKDQAASEILKSKLDESLNGADNMEFMSFADVCNIPPHKRRRITQTPPSMRDLMTALQGSSDNPLDLTGATSISPTKALDLLKTTSLKFLKYSDDVRPPYHGTCTKIPVNNGLRTGRNPFARALPEIDYDYDSEAEWNDDDGEDLESEGEEEINDDEDEDMAEFLDDEEVGTRIGPHDIGDPVCSGICWEGTDGANRGTSTIEGASMERYRFEFCNSEATFPINPFEMAPEPVKQKPVATIMAPPRLPLSTKKENNTLLGAQVTLDGTVIEAPAKPAKPSRLISKDEMEAFKRAVDGSDLTKIGLIEMLKKQFPKEPKDAIKSTLDLVAKRMGEKQATKKWVLV